MIVLLRAISFFFLVALIYVSLAPQSAVAFSGGTKGWCGGLPPLNSGNVACSADPASACQAQFDAWAWQGHNIGPVDTVRWDVKACHWDRELGGGPAGSMVGFECLQGYTPRPGEYCTKDTDASPTEADDKCGGTDFGMNMSPGTGAPIDIRTGAKKFSAVDFRTVDDSLIIERFFNSRSYNSNVVQMVRAPLGLGKNWRLGFQYELHFNNDAGSWAEIATAEGGTHPFVKSGSSLQMEPASWPSPSPRHGFGHTLTLMGTWPSPDSNLLLSSSQWKLRDSKNRIWIFQTVLDSITGKYRVGLPISLTFPNGAAWTFTYGSYNELTSIQDAYGKQITFTWTLQSRTQNGVTTLSPTALKTANLPDGTKLNYVYDFVNAGLSGYNPTDRLIAVEHLDGSNSLLDKTTYLYENADFAWHVTGIVDANNVRRWTVEYDADGHALTSKGPNDASKSTVSYATIQYPTYTRTVTNALGKQTVYTFNGSNAQLKSIDGTASTHCPASNESYEYTYDRMSQVTDAEGRITRFTRNDYGQPTQITEAYGTSLSRTTNITWNSSLALPDQVQRPGLTTTYTWNAKGQPTQVTQTDTTSQSTPYSTNGQTRTWNFTYNTNGSLLTVDGPLSGTGDTVTYTYDASGYVATYTNEVGHVTTVSAVNGRGQPTTIVDPNNVAWNLTYDSEGRLKTFTADPSGLSATTTVDYNVVGDVTKVTRPNGAYLQYTYDNGRRVTKVEDNSGAYVEYDRDNLGNPTARRIKDTSATLLLTQTATFDELGRFLTFVGASSQTWTHGYDKTDNRVTVTDPRTNVFGWTFDALNRLKSTTDEDSNAVTLTRNGKDEITNYSDPRSLSTSFVRNGFGDVIQRTSPDTGTTVYVYNALGKPTQITDGRGVVTNLTYDNAGRLLTKQYPAATSENITYAWDSITGGNKGKGRVTKIDDASGSVEWTYNALGQVTQEKKTTSSVVYAIDYAYDLDGNVAQITYPSGRTVTYSRGSTGLVTDVTTKKDSGSSSVTLATGVSYQPFGPLQTLTYGNGLILWKTFTQDYNLNTLIVEQGSNSVINRGYSYWYNDFNITNIWDNQETARTENYVYTPNGRLQNAYGGWGELTYWQDGVGNRTADIFNDGTTTTQKDLQYPYNTNRVGGATQGSTTLRTITHDGAGNIVTDVRGSTSYNYRYNKRGRLDQLTIGSTVTASYTYDGLERMAVRTTQNMTPSGTTHYVYDRTGRLLAEFSGTGTAQREYVWIDDTPLALVADIDTSTPKLWYVHPDHLDRPSKMTDGSQAVVWDAWYWPYGEARSITGTASNNLRFPGQYFLVESGLNYNWHRHYDSTLGRYLQADPSRDVLASRLVNSNGSVLTARAEMGGGSRLSRALAVIGEFDRQIGLELPEFVDGPSIFAYARSLPTLRIDPTGLGTPLQSETGAGMCQVSGNTLRLYDLYGRAAVDIDYRGTHYGPGEMHFWNWNGGRPARGPASPIPRIGGGGGGGGNISTWQ